jgi:hypothetical protein
LHDAYEVTDLDGDLASFTTRHLSNITDPLVTEAPFNPFATEVQLWLSIHDPHYQPIYLTNQENLAECDLIAAPTPSFISLDVHPDVTPATDTPGQYLEDTPTVSASTQIIPEDSDQAALLTAAAQAELREAIENIPGLEEEPSVLPFHPLAVDGEYVSPSSSILQDYSDIVQGISRPPSTTSSIDPVHPPIPVNPDFRDLLESYEFEVSQQPPQIGIHLNMNPHHNDGSEADSNISTETILVSDDDELPDIPHLSPVPTEEEEVVGQYYRNLLDIYGPMRDLTNFEE